MWALCCSTTDLVEKCAQAFSGRRGGGLLTSGSAPSPTAISQPSMTQLIQRLERRGLVARSADPADRRVALVEISDGGRSLVLEHQDAVRARLRELLTMLPDGQADALSLAARVALPIIVKLIELESARARPLTSV